MHKDETRRDGRLHHIWTNATKFVLFHSTNSFGRMWGSPSPHRNVFSVVLWSVSDRNAVRGGLHTMKRHVVSVCFRWPWCPTEASPATCPAVRPTSKSNWRAPCPNAPRPTATCTRRPPQWCTTKEWVWEVLFLFVQGVKSLSCHVAYPSVLPESKG